jgi:1,4-dihydroxy-2-naphthoate octaprenyltransferase
VTDLGKLIVLCMFGAVILAIAFWINRQAWAPTYKSDDQVRAICREEIALALDGGK